MTGNSTEDTLFLQVSIDHNMDIKEVHGKPRLPVCQPIIWSMVAMLYVFVAVAVIVHTRPQAVPPAMITMRKSGHSLYEYRVPLGGPLGHWSSAKKGSL